MVFKDCHFAHFGTYFVLLRVSRDLIRPRNRSKLVEGSLFAIIDLLLRAKAITYCSDFRYKSNGIFVLRVGFFFFRQISTFYLAVFDGTF